MTMRPSMVMKCRCNSILLISRIYFQADEMYVRLEKVRDNLVSVTMTKWMTSGQRQDIGTKPFSATLEYN